MIIPVSFVLEALKYLTGPSLDHYRIEDGLGISTDAWEYAVTDITVSVDEDGDTSLRCTVTHGKASMQVDVYTGHYSEHEELLFV